jgi:hypothetical protein
MPAAVSGVDPHGASILWLCVCVGWQLGEAPGDTFRAHALRLEASLRPPPGHTCHALRETRYQLANTTAGAQQLASAAWPLLADYLRCGARGKAATQTVVHWQRWLRTLASVPATANTSLHSGGGGGGGGGGVAAVAALGGCEPLGQSLHRALVEQRLPCNEGPPALALQWLVLLLGAATLVACSCVALCGAGRYHADQRWEQLVRAEVKAAAEQLSAGTVTAPGPDFSFFEYKAAERPRQPQRP